MSDYKKGPMKLCDGCMRFMPIDSNRNFLFHTLLSGEPCNGVNSPYNKNDMTQAIKYFWETVDLYKINPEKAFEKYQKDPNGNLADYPVFCENMDKIVRMGQCGKVIA